MLLRALLAAYPHRWVRGDDVSVSGITHDSRQVAQGAVFVAIQGTKEDGLRYAADAVARGAAAIVVGAGRGGAAELSGATRVVEVEDDRAALAALAREFYGRPDEALRVVGVTGTNGKTTTCRIIVGILEAAGIKAGLLGTVSYALGDEVIAAERTTPEAPDIHRYLDRMRAASCGACVMEVSSHSLDLKRVDGIRFAVGVFTNLTREHLDYHHDMEGYFRAKARLFESLTPGAAAVINVDDPHGARLAASIAGRPAGARPELVTFGAGAAATVRIASIETGASGGRIEIAARQGGGRLATPLAGRFNAYNAAAASATALAMGIAWDAVARGVASVGDVPGRMERVAARPGTARRQDFTVLVDYAHKEEALRGLLEAVREITPGRVIVVFGCGGDRDRTKRPLMGAHAARLADVVFVTSDNPRTERPEAIIEEILAGMTQAGGAAATGPRAGQVHVEIDRKKAIESAIGAARPGDAVVIAGKGHETRQIFKDRVIPFDDRVVARAALEKALGRDDGDGPG